MSNSGSGHLVDHDFMRFFVQQWKPTEAEAKDLADAFPMVNPLHWPLGSRVLLQIRRPKRKTRGGIVLVEEARETEKWNTMVAKCIAVGPLAFKNRDSMRPWPEGAWVRPGEFVRVPKYGGDRWEVDIEGDDPALFMICNDHEVIASTTGNPLHSKAFI